MSQSKRIGILAERAAAYESLKYTPDALKDSEKLRRRWYMRTGHRIAERLERAAGDRPLFHLIVPCWLGSAADLYDPAAHKHVHAKGAEIVGSHPAYSSLEYGDGGAIHLHIATTTPMPADVVGGKCKPVYSLPGLITYMGAKPGDARACMVKTNDEWRRYRQNTPENRRDAIRDYLAGRKAAAERGGNMPRLTWTSNLPN